MSSKFLSNMFNMQLDTFLSRRFTIRIWPIVEKISRVTVEGQVLLCPLTADVDHTVRAAVEFQMSLLSRESNRPP